MIVVAPSPLMSFSMFRRRVDLSNSIIRMPSVPGRSSGRLVSKENVDEVEGFLTKNDDLLVLKKKTGFNIFRKGWGKPVRSPL